MKKSLFFIFLFFIILSTTFYGVNNNYAFAEQYYYTYDVEHLFFHCLIAYPEIAFAPNNPVKKSYFNAKKFLTFAKNIGIYANVHEMWSHRLMVRTSPFHGGNMGSSPVGITNRNTSDFRGCFFV